MKCKPISALFLSLFLSLLASVSYAQDEDIVPQIWQMLDYLATDYAEAVAEGEIIDEGEYEEMQEFSATVVEQLAHLSEKESKAALQDQANKIVELVEQKAAEKIVAKQAHDLADELLLAYPIPTAPEQAPDLQLGQQVYQQHCAACHGVEGHADGPLAENLDPPVIAFSDKERADQRSPLSLYQTATQGVEDTGMAAYKSVLSDEERWAVAYYSGTLAYLADITAGEAVWHGNALARAQISNLEELSRTRVNQLDSVLGEEQAQQLIGFLRANPKELDIALSDIALARGRMLASVKAYEHGDVKGAVQLALSAYLDGVEPVEPLLDSHNRALRADIELSMGAYRTSLSKAADLAVIQAQAENIDTLLVEADQYTGHSFRDAGTLFVAAFTILLREGLEALLVVVAIFAFLAKSNRREAMPYVHAGWIGALLAGVLTWAVARYFIEISGASRELTEGVSALFAVVMLLSIGLWMHQKSMGDRWQQYIQEKVGQAMNKKSLGLLFVLAFVTVYREVFETILFYAALWTEGQEFALLGGILAASLCLVVIAWLMLKTSQQLPIGRFFSVSSALIAIIALIMTGKGISALQEAGVLEVTLTATPHIELLGIYPTIETNIAQAVVLFILVIGYLYNRRSA